MNRLIIFNFLLIILWGCHEPKIFSMEMPKKMPPVLKHQTGLSPKLTDKQIVFEKYTESFLLGDARGCRLYANGDYFTIYLGSNKNLYRDSITWKKAGVISQSGIKKIRKISKNSVVDYITEGHHEIVNKAAKNINWYFYFNQPKFVKTQIRVPNWSWNLDPKFVRKMNKVVQRKLTSE